MKKVQIQLDEREANALLELFAIALKAEHMNVIDNVKYFKDKLNIAFNTPEPKKSPKKESVTEKS